MKNAAIRYRINQDKNFNMQKKINPTNNYTESTWNAQPFGQLSGK
jgi:hypothetical protein